MFVESAFAFITLFNVKGREGYQHVAPIWANQCDLNITKNIHKRWLKHREPEHVIIVKASHFSNHILHFNTLRPLPDLQQGFSPTTKNSRKMQNPVRIQLVMRLKFDLRAYAYMRFNVSLWCGQTFLCRPIVAIFVSRISKR